MRWSRADKVADRSGGLQMEINVICMWE